MLSIYWKGIKWNYNKNRVPLTSSTTPKIKIATGTDDKPSSIENSVSESKRGIDEVDEVIQYQMSKTITTIHDLWREWKEGLGGHPPVELLEKRFKARCRRNHTDGRFFIR
jgi:hypothetical protein